MSARPAGRSRLFLLAVKIAVSGGLLWILFDLADPQAIGSRLRQMEVNWLLVALAFYAAHVWVSAWRWRVLLATQRVQLRTSRLAESFVVALFFNNFLPSNIGGDVMRVADTAGATGSRTLAATVVLVDRVIGCVALFFVAALGSLLAAGRGAPVPGAWLLWLVVTTASVGGVVFFIRPRLLERLASPLRWVGSRWIDKRLAWFADALRRFRRSPAELVAAFAGAIVEQGLFVFFYLSAARGLAIPLPWLLGAVVVPISLAVQLLPVSINGFGVREATFTYFLTRAGLDVESALALSLVGAGLVLLFSLGGGALFLLRRGGNARAAIIRYQS